MEHWQDRRVLVTGAYGFLASHMIEELLSRGAIVTGIVRDQPRRVIFSSQVLTKK